MKSLFNFIRNEPSLNWIIRFIIIIILSVLAFYFFNKFFYPSKYLRDLSKNAGLVSITNEIEINSTIKSIASDRGIAFIACSNDTVYTLSQSRNYSYSSPYSDEFIVSGDKIRKNKESDTLWIMRDGQNYFFIIGKFINKVK